MKFEGKTRISADKIQKVHINNVFGMKNIIYPGNNQKIRLEFKYFSRVEGKIRLKKNFKISNISVQLFEDFTDDKPRYSSSFRIGKN